MTEGARISSRSHLKAIVIGGGIVGGIGTLLGYAASLTEEGAVLGFVLGWVVGELLALSSIAQKPK